MDTAANLVKLFDKVGVPTDRWDPEVVTQELDPKARAEATTSLALPLLDLEPPDAALPSAFDWRNYSGGNWLTSVRDQGICGSCWAFSAVAVTEAAHNIATGDPGLDLNLSEQYLVTDCCGAGNCVGGYKDQALVFIRDSGVVDESCLTYRDGGSTGCTYNDDMTCASNCTYRSGSSCSDYRCSDRCGDWASRLTALSQVYSLGNYPDRDDMKQALIDIGPVAVSMYPYGDWVGDVMYCSDNTSTGHAVVVVGYNDAGGYWILRNSWGSGWNDGGYYKVAYGTCAVEKYPLVATATVGSPPSNVQASDGAYDDRIRVTWSAKSGATGYDVYRAVSDSDPLALLGSTTGTTYDDLTAGSEPTYYYAVAACNDTGCSSPSARNSGYRRLVADAYEADNAAGQAKTIAAGATQRHSIVPDADQDWVRFTLPLDSEVIIETAGFGGDDTVLWLYDSAQQQLDYDDDGGTDLFSRIDRVCGQDALPAGTYYVRVGEFGDNDRIGAYDLTLTVPRDCVPVPSAPTGVTASEGSPTLTVSWNAADYATSYKVSGATSSDGAKTLLGETADTHWYHGDAMSLTTYYYWVQACNQVGCSDYSAYDTGQRTSVTPTRFSMAPIALRRAASAGGDPFESPFTSDSTGWSPVAGVWTLSGGALRTNGLAGAAVSVAHEGTYAALDYAVRLRRTGASTYSNRIIIRGQPCRWTPAITGTRTMNSNAPTMATLPCSA